MMMSSTDSLKLTWCKPRLDNVSLQVTRMYQLIKRIKWMMKDFVIIQWLLLFLGSDFLPKPHQAP